LGVRFSWRLDSASWKPKDGANPWRRSMRNMRPRVAGLWLALVLVLVVNGSAFAQTGAASITGLLTDQSGAAVPAATVTATNQATNVPYTAVSNDAGNYPITSVPVGTYVVKAEQSGFKTAATKPI